MCLLRLEQTSADDVLRLADAILHAVVTHRVGDRPDRYEPRARKRRPKPYPLLERPQATARKRFLYND